MIDKTKILNLLEFIFKGDQKNALNHFTKIFDEGLDGKLFLNDILEIIYPKFRFIIKEMKNININVHILHYLRESQISNF